MRHTRLKTVIVDDEQPICDEIEFLLKKHIDVEVIAKFTNSLEALHFISEHDCQLIFLDIHMPGMSGLEMASRLNVLRERRLIVFVTAFSNHALEAFDTPAVGYITKPITEEKLARIMNKIRNLTAGLPSRAKAPVSKVCVVANGRIIPIDKQEIVFAYVKDKDVFIRTKTGEFATTMTLQEIENILSDLNFLRVHRQYIVNLDKVLEVIPWFHGSYLLRMEDYKRDEVPVSRNRVKTLKAIIGLK